MKEDITMGSSYLSTEDLSCRRWPVHVEVRLSAAAKSAYDTIHRLVLKRLVDDYTHIYMPSVITGWEDCPILKKNVERIVVSESGFSHQSLPLESCLFEIHVYQPTDCPNYDRMSTNPSQPGEEINAASVSELPSRELEGLWESLFYEGNVKSGLLNYIYATVGFSDAGVNHNLVSWNRLVLLHGPPGTGKTSLCRALAQKLSIRLGSRYPHTRLLEINSHSLFSRWFSESGKLVQSLFTSVEHMIEDEDGFVVLLIDEVESLTAARAGAMAGTEPSDALRVVNALLTQLDKLKRRKNVLVMSTSNLAKAIDAAFVDRADIVQYIDLPPREAVYEILRSCLGELMSKGIVISVDIPTAGQASIFHKTSSYPEDISTVQEDSRASVSNITSENHSRTVPGDKREISRHVGLRLFTISEKCKGMSGRTLRRLPVLAHARYIGLFPTLTYADQMNENPKRSETNGTNGTGGNKVHRKTGVNHTATPVEVWLNAMEKVIDEQLGSRVQLGQ